MSQSWQNTLQPLLQTFNNLDKRDQIALVFLCAFLLVFGLGFGGWTLHQKANATQKAYDNTIADVFWLRSQAGNINPNQTQALNKAELIRQVFSQSGITAQVVENSNTVQVSFSHNQAGAISNIFSQLSQQGITIQQLQINQPSPDRLDVQAVLSTQ